MRAMKLLGRVCLALLLVAAMLTLIIPATPVAAASPTVIYVNDDAVGWNNGTSWGNAYKSLQAALTAATAGQEIWVAAGTYMPSTTGDRTASFVMKSGVALYGGFAGTETTRDARDWKENVSLLSGNVDNNDNDVQDSCHVLRAPSGTDDTAILDGFLVRDGIASGYPCDYSRGAGMFIQSGYPTIRNTTFRSHSAGLGGAMYVEGSPTLENVSFIYNRSNSGYGGAMYISWGDVVLTNVEFRGNFARASGFAWGGAVLIEGGSLVGTNVLFSGNFVRGEDLGANRLGYGGAIARRFSGSVTLYNATFASNSAAYGGAVSGGVTLYNSILWGNFAAQSAPDIYDWSAAISCLVQTGCPDGTCIDVISGDPKFVSAVLIPESEHEFGDYHLKTDSDAIDAGNNAHMYADRFDLDGDGNITEPVSRDRDLLPRVVNGTVDLGPYEVQDSTPPTGTVSINGNATYATNPVVTLTLSANDDMSAPAIMDVMVANYIDFNGGVWQPFTASKPWTLSPGDGSKTVYVKYRDATGNVSSTYYTDSIILDTVAPAVTVQSATGSGGTDANNADGIAVVTNSDVTLTWYGNDLGSYALKKGTSCAAGTLLSGSNVSGTWNGFITTSTLSLSNFSEGANTVWVCLTDAATNTGGASATITRDTTAPGVTVASLSGSGGTDSNGADGFAIITNTDPILTWSATEAGTYALKQGTSCAAGTAVSGAYVSGAYTSGPVTSTVSLSSLADGSNTLWVCFADRVNQTASASASVLKDITAPTVTLATPANGSVLGGALTFSGTASSAARDLPGVTVRVYSGTGTGGILVQTLETTAVSGAYSIPTSLVPGNYTAQAQQWDSVGNTANSTTTTFTVEITGGIIYVRQGATGAQTGVSWDAAYSDLQSALAAATPGEGQTVQIWVSAGVYRPGSGADRNATFALKNNVAVYGGFPSAGAPGWASRNPTTNVTTLSGDLAGNDPTVTDNAYHVVSASGTDSTAILDGFTITAGTANATSPNNSGGGMLIASASPSLRNLVISGNTATYRGGGASVEGGSPSFTLAKFSNNSATNAGSSGGGLSVDDSAPGSYDSSPSLTSVIFTGNTAVYCGSGIIVWNGGNLLLTNAAIYGNPAPGAGGVGWGLYLDPSAAATLQSVSMGNNAGDGGTEINGSGYLAVTNSVIWGYTSSVPSGSANYSAMQSPPAGGTGNITLSASPFADAELHLSGGSPAIDAGNSALLALDLMDLDGDGNTGEALPRDLRGNPRLYDDVGTLPNVTPGTPGPLDMGAYEFQGTTAFAGPVIYVDRDATGSNSGGSWTNAFTSLQSALAAANTSTGNTYEIWVAAGTYTPGTARGNIFTMKNGVAIYGGFGGTEATREARDWQTNLTILSGDIEGNDVVNAYGVTTTIIGTNSDTLIVAPYGTDASAVLDGFTVCGGDGGGDGGGIRIAGSPTLRDLSFTANRAAVGGGVCVLRGNPTLTRVAFSSNVGLGLGGGGMYIESGDATLTDVIFEANTATGPNHGGGLWVYSGSPTLTRVTFAGNSADSGAGLAVWYGNVTLTDVRFSDNVASYSGGGMYAMSGTAVLNSVTFDGNTSTYASGGGLSICADQGTLLTNVTFTGNKTTGTGLGGGYGGGIYVECGNPILNNVTITGNAASVQGGGIYSYGSPTLTNAIVWDNSAPTGPQAYVASTASLAISYSDIQGSGGSAVWNLTGSSDAGHNIDADPWFVSASDLDLQAGSPAIDQGNSAAAGLAGVTTDILARPRLHDDTGTLDGAGGYVDMGAYEFQGTTIDVPVITSAESAMFTVGTYGAFEVEASGVPLPTITIGASDALPFGISYNSSTATLSGTPGLYQGGQYTLHWTATNTAGTDSQEFSLVVNEALSMGMQPVDQIVEPGASVSFSASAGGYPRPDVQWQVMPAGAGDWASLTGETSTTLTLTGVTSGMNGNRYRAVFTNATQTLTSDAATLTVQATYTVTFDAQGGTAVSSQTVADGEPATEPSPAPTRTGYTFSGWFTDNTTYTTQWDFGTDVITGDKILYARWTPLSYTVTFDSQGGSSVASQTVAYNGMVTEPAAPTRTDYAFGGWFKDSDGTVPWLFANDRVTGDITLYALWGTLVDHTVTFDANGGSGAMTQQTANVPTALTFNTFSRTGYTFAGWNTLPGGGGASYADGAIYAFGVDATLYAQWTALPMRTVAFDTNGGTGSMSQQTANVPTALTLNTFTRAGYSFGGWNTAANGSGDSYADGATYSFAADVTLYAQWTILPMRTVTFNANSGAGSMAPQSANVPTDLTLNAFTRSGYSFAGWNTAANGSGDSYADGANYSFATDVTLYAQWMPLPMHTVTFDDNGGTGEMAPQTANVPTALTTNTFTRTGFTFDGWNTAADGSGTSYADGAIFSFDEDLTLYAKWNITFYTVTFNSQGGSAVTNQSVAYNGHVIKPAAPTRDGYTFGGWYREAACTDAWDFASDVVTASITLYAKWTINSYTVTFNSQGGSLVDDQSVEYNSLASEPDAPTKTGYTFDGWYKEAACLNAWDFSTDVVTEAVTLYAKWNVIICTVTFDSQGGSAVTNQSVAYNGHVTKPADPTREGYTFGGWYREDACTNSWDFASDVVTGDVTLYAKWNIIFYTVTFNSQGGSEVTSQSVAYNDHASKPADPTREGYTFGGWYKEAACLNAWDFSTDVVTEAVTLYAKWTSVVTLAGVSPASLPVEATDRAVTLTGTGLAAGAQVRWYESAADYSTDLTPDSVSGTELVFTAPADRLGVAMTVELTVSNLDGGASNIQPLLVTTAGTSVSGADTGVSDGGTAEATIAGTVSATGSGDGTLYVAEYDGNPAGASAFVAAGTYVDVYASADSGFDSVVVQVCSSDLKHSSLMYWWDPSSGAWEAVSPSATYSAGPPECLTFTADSTSSPSVDDLTGTVFVAGSGSYVQVLKLTDGALDASQTWVFSLWAGAGGFGGTALASDSTLGDADGQLDFDDLDLDPWHSYTLCEQTIPAGWTSFWKMDSDGDGDIDEYDAILVPYNPNESDDPPADLGNRCVDLGAGTGIGLPSDGGTLQLMVNNTYPGGDPRSAGYWKNWNRCTGGGQQYTADANGGYSEGFWLLDDVLDPSIGGGVTWDDILDDDVPFPIASCAVAVDVLDRRDIGDNVLVADGAKLPSDAAYTLASELLAAQLNFGAGARTCDAALDAALSAEELLDKYDFNGSGSFLPSNSKIKKIKEDYATALVLAGVLDQYNNGLLCIGPTVAFIDPLDGAVLAGDETLAVRVNDSAPITAVEFSVDGVSIGVDAAGSDGWTIVWDSSSVADGSHTLVAAAVNSVGQTGTADVVVEVQNVVASPQVTITSPEGGATVRGDAVNVTAAVTSGTDITQVEFLVDDTSIGTDTDGSDGWSAVWNLTGVADGSHSLSAVATDSVPQTGIAAIDVYVDNVVDRPQVTITSPAGGDTVSGASVTIAAQVVAEAAVTQVEFLVDDASIGTDTDGSDGWSAVWNLVGVADGSHSLSAVVTDTLAQTGRARASVNVRNTVATVRVIDLLGSSTVINRNRWRATVTVTIGPPMAGAVVSGAWSTGQTLSCTTDANGTCSVSLDLKNEVESVKLTVDNVSIEGYEYTAGMTDVEIKRP